MNKIMKAFTLLLLSWRVFTFKIKSELKFLSQNEIKLLNTALSGDGVFADLVEETVLGSGSFGTVVHMKDGNGDFAVKIGDDYNVLDNEEPLGLDGLKIPEDKLNETALGVRMTDFLRIIGVPMVSYVRTYRHILYTYEVEKDKLAVGAKAIQIMNFANKGDLWNYAIKVLASETNVLGNEQKLAIFTKLFYKMMITLKSLADNGICHGDVKPDNTFLDDTEELLGESFNPIIGDWDLAYKYDLDFMQSNKLRYTPWYRPPEMDYFKVADRTIKTGPLGFVYSGTEDLFALAVSMMEVAIYGGITLTQPLIEILDAMASPLSHDQLVARSAGTLEERNQACVDSMTGLENKLDGDFATKVTALHEKSKPVIDAILTLDTVSFPDLVEFFATRKDSYYESTGVDYEKYYELLEKFFVARNHNLTQIKSLIDILVEEQVEFTEQNGIDFMNKLEALNSSPFSAEIANRLGHVEILKRLYKIIHPQATTETLGTKVQEDQNTLEGLAGQKQLFEDGQRSHVIVDPSFYNVGVGNIETIFEKYNNIHNRTDRTTVRINPLLQSIQSYSVYMFGKELLEMTDHYKGTVKGYENIPFWFLYQRHGYIYYRKLVIDNINEKDEKLKEIVLPESFKRFN